MADEVLTTPTVDPTKAPDPEPVAKTEDVANHDTLKALSPDDLVKEVLSLRRSEAAFRVKAKKAEDTAAQLKADQEQAAEAKRQADLTEAQKLTEALAAETAKRTALEEKMRQDQINVGLLTALTAKGLKAHRIDDVFQFVDRSAIAADSTGKMSGFETALDALQADRPYLFDSKPAASGLPGAGPALEKTPGIMSTGDLMKATQLPSNDPAHQAAKAELKKRGALL